MTTEIFSSGCLFVVATPIGNLKDITFRAIEVLKTVDVIAAEDTRHTQKLLQYYGISKRLISLHEYNEMQKIATVLELIRSGKQVALVSDAGTPLINDPGFQLVKALQVEKIKISPIPGACAAICALSVAGLPTDRFVFEGFLPAKKTAALAKLNALLQEPRTIIFYEAPHRIEKTLALLLEVFGVERQACIARELTKTFETIRLDTLLNLQNWLTADVQQQKGEFVILISGCKASASLPDEAELERLLTILLAELPLKQAVDLAVDITGQKRNYIYKIALSIK